MTGSAKENHAQLVEDQEGTVIVRVYDLSSFFVCRKLQGIKKYHQFYMSSNNPGKFSFPYIQLIICLLVAALLSLYFLLGELTAKMFHDSEDSIDHQLMTQTKFSTGIPEEIVQAGLPKERQQHLAKEIREF